MSLKKNMGQVHTFSICTAALYLFKLYHDREFIDFGGNSAALWRTTGHSKNSPELFYTEKCNWLHAPCEGCSYFEDATQEPSWTGFPIMSVARFPDDVCSYPFLRSCDCLACAESTSSVLCNLLNNSRR